MDKILEKLNARFDHAALKPETTPDDIVKLCREAQQFDLYAVAVNPAWVSLARSELVGSRVKIVSVAGFPLGASLTELKVAEAARAVKDGAHEIDMVANIGWLVAGHPKKAAAEIAEVRRNLPFNIVLKVIIEAGKLSTDQQAAAVEAVVDGGAQFVKTSTGFFGGAMVEHVQTLHKAAEGRIEIKASGGIRNLEQCKVMLEAGASRLGSSASGDIMREHARLTGSYNR